MRGLVVEQIVDRLVASRLPHPVRVAVDGITAAGKTTWAREIIDGVGRRGRQGIHISMDGFHHLREHRYRQGRGSAVGYYEDAYDFDSFAREVLIPLGPEGDRRYRTRIMDLATNLPVQDTLMTAQPDAVLVVDGSFLQRDLRGLWDVVVFVDTSFEMARDRGTQRDATLFGGVDKAAAAFDERYHVASRMYLEQVQPARQADIVIDNNDLSRPRLTAFGA
ncbi:hypothetical protein ACIA8C_07745 [Nocardia sp. NPDC051321]|uniref:hypothetical protein n=1 Tax=Nocardia sp. NPDC051321 TaxID=3364323 RepID=UPI00379AC4DC